VLLLAIQLGIGILAAGLLFRRRGPRPTAGVQRKLAAET